MTASLICLGLSYGGAALTLACLRGYAQAKADRRCYKAKAKRQDALLQTGFEEAQLAILRKWQYKFGRSSAPFGEQALPVLYGFSFAGKAV